MISKRVTGRKDGKSSAQDALRYGEGLTPNRETGELLDKSHRTRLGNFGLVDDGVYVGQDMAEMIHLAAIEMQSNCALNNRVEENKKLAHFVVSFNQERPSEAVLRDTEDSMLSAMKLDKNHFATFLHNDNGYWHLHIFSSRIEKENNHRGNSLWQDQTIRDRVCREVEIRHGLQRDNGLHEIDAQGQIVVVPKIVRIAKREAKQTEVSVRAKNIEKYSGEKSFQSWANEIRIGDRLKHAKSWQDLHAAAASYGCEVKQKVAGFVICPTGEKGGIQLSKIGLKNLPAKFGAFESAKLGHKAQPEAIYKPAPTDSKGASKYSKWREAKESFQPIKTEKINELRESHKTARSMLREKQKSELAKIRKSTSGTDKLAAISIAKMQHAVDLAALTDRFARERQALHKQLAATGPGFTFRDYLVREAEKGDDVALILARKYGVEESTKVLGEREAEKLKIKAALSGTEQRTIPRLQFTHTVERTGTVIYNFGKGRIITDSAISKQIQLNDTAANDPAAIATSLRFAAAKFGNTLTLAGSPAFQKLAVETAVANGLFVKFADPDLDAYREKLALQKQKNCIPDFSHLTQAQLKKGVEHVLKSSFDRGIPPDHIIHRNAVAAEQFKAGAIRTSSLSELPARNLDAARHKPGVLLPGTVPERVDNHATGQNNDLRRAGTSAAGRRSRRIGSLENNSAFDFGVGVDSSIKPAPQGRKQAQRAVEQPVPTPIIEVPPIAPLEAVQTVEQRLRALILETDPAAIIILADQAKNQTHTGRIVQACKPGEDPVFIQSKGQGAYIIHHIAPPVDVTGTFSVKYKNGQVEVSKVERGGRGIR